MFERFTDSARAVVRGALERAERAGDDPVRDEHLFLTLLDARGTPAAAALAALGIIGDRDAVERALAEARRRGGLSRADAEALAGLGIDVTEVVSRVEEAHGEGALAGAGTPEPHDLPGRPWKLGRRRGAGRSRFAKGAKQVLERSLREALERGDKHIGDEHLLLALTNRPGVVADVLSEHGATYADVRRVLARQAAAG
jgi:ATP-dependent Clp protease ATP-binding subunit ClpA